MEQTRRQHFRRKEDILALQRAADDGAPDASRQVHRFVSRDGRVNILKYGLLRRQPFDWYHLLMTIRWPWLILVCGIGYILVNALFALLYMAEPHGLAGVRPYRFFEHFFFSSHVFSTLGFSDMYPLTAYTNALTTVESFIGWCSFGLITGLLFSRFSRPSARVIFSHFSTIEPYDGKPTLTFRAANRRGNLILQSEIRVTMSRNEKTLEGENIRRIYDLKLVRATTSIFNLTWTVRHVIDEHSPLYGQTPEMLRASETELTVLLSGTDDTFGQTVYGHFAYNHEEMVFDHHFQSMFMRNEEGHPVIDFSKFDAIEKNKTDEHPAPVANS